MEPEALEILDPGNNEGYGSARLPCGRDEEIARLVRRVDGPAAFSAAERALSQENAVVLTAFAERMATLAVREGSVRVVRDGLAAAQLALAVTGDQRESLPALSLLFRAEEILGADPVDEFEQVAALAAAPADRPLLDFAARGGDERSVASMGYVEVRDEAGFRFERTW